MKLFYTLLFISGIYAFCTPPLAAQIADSIAIGVVRYIQIADLTQEREKNGISVLLFNATISAYIQTGAPAETKVNEIQDGTLVSTPGDPKGFPIFKNHRNNEITYRTQCFNRDWGKYCLVKDTLNTVKWEIDPSAKKRFGIYECLKAEGRFRGRDYEVWFAPEIPIPSGPFKLGGLPGLILEAKSKDGLVQFLFHSLEISEDYKKTISYPEGFDTKYDFSTYNTANFNSTTEIARRVVAERGGSFTVSKPIGELIEYW